MSKRLSWDIHTRTQIISLGPALLLTLLLISFFTFVRIQDLRQELNHTGQLIANQLAPASEYGVISGNNEVLDSLMRATLSIPHVRFLEVQDSRNHILVYVEQPDESLSRAQRWKCSRRRSACSRSAWTTTSCRASRSCRASATTTWDG
jgi:hypothetical protein